MCIRDRPTITYYILHITRHLRHWNNKNFIPWLNIPQPERTYRFSDVYKRQLSCCILLHYTIDQLLFMSFNHFLVITVALCFFVFYDYLDILMVLKPKPYTLWPAYNKNLFLNQSVTIILGYLRKQDYFVTTWTQKYTVLFLKIW